MNIIHDYLAVPISARRRWYAGAERCLDEHGFTYTRQVWPLGGHTKYLMRKCAPKGRLP